MSDGDRGRDPVDAFSRRLVQSFQELSSISSEALDVSALPLGVQSVKCEAGLATTTNTTDYYQLAVRNVEINLLQVVDLNAAK